MNPGMVTATPAAPQARRADRRREGEDAAQFAEAMAHAVTAPMASGTKPADEASKSAPSAVAAKPAADGKEPEPATGPDSLKGRETKESGERRGLAQREPGGEAPPAGEPRSEAENTVTEPARGAAGRVQLPAGMIAQEVVLPLAAAKGNAATQPTLEPAGGPAAAPAAVAAAGGSQPESAAEEQGQQDRPQPDRPQPEGVAGRTAGDSASIPSARFDAGPMPGRAAGLDVREGSALPLRAPAPASPVVSRPPVTEVALQLQGELGVEGRLRVALRGDTLRVIIHATDPRAALQLGARMEELQRNLAVRGFSETRIEIHHTGGQGTRTGEGGEETHRERSGEQDPRHPRQDPHKQRDDARRRAFLDDFWR